jgi:hypothetical protein
LTIAAQLVALADRIQPLPWKRRTHTATALVGSLWADG